MSLVSIVMATRNENPRFLNECIQSLINQTFTNYNLYIVIDKKNDRNFNYLNKICQENDNFNLLINSNSSGVSSSRNFGIKNSDKDSKFISIVDSDDFYHELKLEKQVNILCRNKEYSVVGTNLFLVDQKSKIIGERLYPKLNKDILKQFLFKMPIANSSILLRKKDLLEIGLFNEDLKKAEDFELWLRFLAKKKQMYNIQKKLVFYRSPNDENLKRGREHYKNYYNVFKRNSKNIWPLYKRIIPLLLFYVIKLLPNNILSILLNTKFVFMLKKIKKES